MGVDESLDVVVVGGGISGLTASYGLHAKNPTARIALLERSATVGGKIRSLPFAGTVVDRGPEGFLAKSATVPDLCTALGLAGALVHPAGAAPGIVVNGQLRSIPRGILGGIPTDPVAAVRSGLVPWTYLLNARLDQWRPSRAPRDDTSIGAVVRQRLGRRAVENIVQPLLGGITAGDVDHTSLEQCAPALANALASRRGLIDGMRAMGTPPAGTFMSFRGGMQTLAGAIAEKLPAGSVRPSTTITRLDPYLGGWVITANSRRIFTPQMVLCIPPDSAAPLLSRIAPEAASLLTPFTSASVAIITLAFPRDAFPHPPAATGFVVAPKEGHLLTACTWMITKWPHLRNSDVVIARCSVGRASDTRCEKLGDHELEQAVEAELRALSGAATPALERATVRWNRAMPMFPPGHAGRVQRVRAALPDGITLLGEAYDGVGIHQCVDSALRAAQTLPLRIREQVR